MQYSQGFIARQVRRMAGPGEHSANALSKEVGVPQATLSRWLRSASNVDRLRSESSNKQSGARSSSSPEEKPALLARAAGLEGEALGRRLLAGRGIAQVNPRRLAQGRIRDASSLGRDATTSPIEYTVVDSSAAMQWCVPQSSV
jgi:hypothetical protein